MARTVLMEFDGTPDLTPEKVENIKEWYAQLQGDCDKADDLENEAYYSGGVDMAVSILKLLYNVPQEGE